MTKKNLIVLVAAFVLAIVGPAQAQQPSKIQRIGFLSGGFPGPSHWTTRLRTELRELGYVEGKNVAIESRFSENKLDRVSGLADELVSLKVDVIVAGGGNDARAAKNATTTIPIVGLTLIDPVASGLVDSLARPGGNVTGFTTIADVLAGKRFELLKETIPKLSRVALLWNPKEPTGRQRWQESQTAARELGLQLHSMEASGADKFEAAFKEATKARSEAFSTTASPLIVANQKRIVDLAAKYRLPGMYDREEFVANGGLMSYGADDSEQFKRVAVFVDKILKGTKPADIPVEQPKKFELIVNLKAAKQIGLTIPPYVLSRADRVIK
jgi:putative ABC transport system substrate-binding protein